MIYEAIMKQVVQIDKDGYVPAAVRLNGHTRSRLLNEVGRDSCHRGELQSTGQPIWWLITMWGNILLSIDSNMPDDCVILQITPAPLKKYYGPVTVTVEKVDNPSGES